MGLMSGREHEPMDRTSTHARMDVCAKKATSIWNEYHSVCCSMSGIMWGIELVEGKDAPRACSTSQTKHNNHGNTVGLLLRILQPIFTKG